MTIRDPSGLNDAECPHSVCPLSVRTSAPLLASQTFAVLSSLAVTIRDPSGLNDAEMTASVCPLSVRTSAPLFASHTFAVLSRLAVTIRDPSGLNDAEMTLTGVPLEREELGTALRVPDLRRLVLTRGDDPRPVGAERRRSDADRCAP